MLFGIRSEKSSRMVFKKLNIMNISKFLSMIFRISIQENRVQIIQIKNDHKFEWNKTRCLTTNEKKINFEKEEIE